MDGVDFRLLGQLVQEPFATQEALAREVGLSAGAVRRRLRLLGEEGVLRGWSALPAAGLFGRQAVGAAWHRTLDPDLLLAVPDTLWAADSVDGRAGAMGYTRDPDAWLADVTAAAGGEAPWQEVHLPTAQLPAMGPLEWRVLAAMVTHPRATIRDLSAASGLAPRTVRARHDALLASGSVKVEPLLRPSRTGALAYHLYIEGPPDAQARAAALVAAADATEHLVIDRYETGLYLFVLSPSLGDQGALVARLRDLAGVADVQVVLNRDYRLHHERLLGWIDEQLTTWRGHSGP
ncbi:MAG: winged helix-turn-helix transcriptional regulator [Thermoplasmatota archaeon]